MCATADSDDVCFDSAIDDMCNPLECEVHDKGKSDCINNLISITSTKLTQHHALKIYLRRCKTQR